MSTFLLLSMASPALLAVLCPYATLFRSDFSRGGGRCSGICRQLCWRTFDKVGSSCCWEPVLLVARRLPTEDRKSTRLNSSDLVISYAVFCLKKHISDAVVQREPGATPGG